MDKRSEPRFPIRSTIKIAAFDHPEQVCEATLLDVSGAGLKIVADNWWPLETPLVIELENHLVVARVRNIVARGPKFSLGAERVYSVLKLTLPTGVSRTVWHNLLRSEMRDLPAIPENSVTDDGQLLENASQDEVPTVQLSEIAEQKVEQEVAQEETASPIEAQYAGPSLESALHTEQLPEDQPADAQSSPEESPGETSLVAQSSVESSEVALAAVDLQDREEPPIQHTLEPVVENTQHAAIAERESIGSDLEPQTGGVLQEAWPVDPAPPPSDLLPALVEALPSELQPEALPMRQEETVVPDLTDTPVFSRTTDEGDVPLAVEPQTAQPDTTAPQEVSSEANPVAGEASLSSALENESALETEPSQDASPVLNSLTEPSDPVGDVTDTNHGTSEEHGRRAENSTLPGDPPLARAFALVPKEAPPEAKLASASLTPQFGPSYGMAPTADALLPVSTMPESTPPEAKPAWVMSSAVAAAVIGLSVLAFYYGPFRPRAASAPRLQPTTNSESPLTIPPVTQAPKIAKTTASSVASQTGAKPVPVQTVKVIPPVVPTPAPTQAASTKAPVTSTAKVVQTAGVVPSGSTQRVTIKAASLLWFSACSDGKPVFQRVFQAGESMNIEFRQMTVFKLGNAAAAEMTMDGKPLGSLGAPGTVKLVEVTAAGVHELPPTTASGTECQPMRASVKP